MRHETNICPICGKGNLEIVLGYTYEYKGNTLTLPNYTSYVCSHCGQDMEFGDDNINLDDEIMNFMRKIDGLLTPKDICRMRKSLGLTQKSLAEILGVGEKTFARYENGSVTQSRIMDNFLRVMGKHPEILETLAGTPGSRFAYTESMRVKYILSDGNLNGSTHSAYQLAATGTCEYV